MLVYATMQCYLLTHADSVKALGRVTAQTTQCYLLALVSFGGDVDSCITLDQAYCGVRKRVQCVLYLLAGRLAGWLHCLCCVIIRARGAKRATCYISLHTLGVASMQHAATTVYWASP